MKRSAASSLGRVSTDSVAVDSDRAVVALSKGAPQEALVILQGVLERAPNHAPALWNRGLALRELGLELLAAQSFAWVAALNEPGWSDEARPRAGLALQVNGAPPEAAGTDAPTVQSLAPRGWQLAVEADELARKLSR